MVWKTQSNSPDATLGVSERMAYLIGNAGTALINTIVATFLMFFYTDVLFLNASIVGIILLVSRLFDGVTDIIMGFIVDRTVSPLGKGRVWLLRICLPYAISGLLLTFVPTFLPEWAQYTYIFISYNLCNSILLTALYVPYNTMTYSMSTKPYERGLLGTFATGGAVLGTVAVSTTVINLAQYFGGGIRGWQITVGIYAIIGLLAHLLCFKFTRERYVSAASEAEKKLDVAGDLKALFKNKYWFIAILLTFFLLFFTALFGGSGIYFAKGILGNEGYYAQISSTMALTQLLTLFVAFLPMKYLGKRNTALLGSLIISLGLVVQIFVSDSLAGLVFCSVLKGVGAGFVGAVLYGMVADTIDYGQWKFNKRLDGVGMSALTFVTKVSGGLAGAVIGFLLDVGKYDASATVQAGSANFVLYVAFTYLPLLCMVVTAILLVFYKLEGQLPHIQAELAQRSND